MDVELDGRHRGDAYDGHRVCAERAISQSHQVASLHNAPEVAMFGVTVHAELFVPIVEGSGPERPDQGEEPVVLEQGPALVRVEDGGIVRGRFRGSGRGARPS